MGLLSADTYNETQIL